MAVSLSGFYPYQGIGETIYVIATDGLAAGAGYSELYIELKIEVGKDVLGSIVYEDLVTIRTQGVWNDTLQTDISWFLDGLFDEMDFPWDTSNFPHKIPVGFGHISVRLTANAFGDGVLQSTAQDTMLVFDATYPGQYIERRRFLTDSPPLKLTSKYIPEYVYFVPTTSYTSKLAYQCTFTDGTVSAIAYSSALPVVARELICYPCGYEVLNLAAQPKEVASWQVWVVQDPDTPRSDPKTFWLDCYDSEERGRYFVFQNSNGCWDVAMLTGVQTENLQTSSDVVALADISTLGGTKFSRLRHRNTRNFPNWEIASGYQPEGHGTWLRDLVVSERVFRMNDFDPAEWYDLPQAVMIDRGSIRVKEDEDDFDAIRFTYRDANNQKGLWTPEQ